MILGVDASNIRAGGGVTHLQNILEYLDPKQFDITKVIVWGGGNPLDRLPRKPWLDLREVSTLNSSLHKRLLWQQIELGRLAHKNCDLLFSPGGLYLGDFRPYVTMFQNMQIFETKERNRENYREWLRLKLLQLAQGQTFRKASGLICLSEYTRNYLIQNHPRLVTKTPVQLIAHGADSYQVEPILCDHENFEQKSLKFLYVSTVKKYKHQWNLIDAVGLLSKEGFSIELHIIGDGDIQALSWMRTSMERNDPDGQYIFYHGALPHKETLSWYNKVDVFVFPSTCETFGISLLEAMTAGLPIASSDRGPLPEVLKDSGLYFNPESVVSIKNCLQYLIDRPELRNKLADKAQSYSHRYSWKKCSNETFSFLRYIYEENKR